MTRMGLSVDRLQGWHPGNNFEVFKGQPLGSEQRPISVHQRFNCYDMRQISARSGSTS